jgi:hypothetical protein
MNGNRDGFQPSENDHQSRIDLAERDACLEKTAACLAEVKTTNLEASPEETEVAVIPLGALEHWRTDVRTGI